MLKNYPKISIVTPSFNQAQFLEATINSILSQNYPNLEYIIIDGGSTDGSVEIIKKYENYLHFWCSEPDGGHYVAINKGFAKSSGEIMAWLNSDDMYFNGSLNTVASIMSELKEIEWLTTLNPAGYDYQGFCTGFTSIPGYSREAFLDGYYAGKFWIQQESTFWRRSLWEKIGSHIRDKFKFAGDFDLWSRFFCHADLYGTSSPLGGFRTRFNQRVRQGNFYHQEVDKSIAEYRKLINWSPNRLRDTTINTKLNKLPKIKNIFIELYGYNAKKVVRERRDMADSFWNIEKHKFL